MAVSGEEQIVERRSRQNVLSNAGAPAIETLNLRKVYGRKMAVDRLTLAVGRGEVFGFLGPNGAGKSTVVKMLMGLISPTGGTARLLGEPIGNLAVKARVGFLPEQFRFHEWLQGAEFLEFHGRLNGMSKDDLKRRVPAILDLVGLAGCGRDRLQTYSKGMLQRIGIGQALIHDPALVFLDEPTSALDPIGRRDVRDLIRALKQQGKTVFLNSHLLSEVELVCDRVAIITRGTVVRQGLLRDLLADGQEVEIQVGNMTAALRDTLASRYRVLDMQEVAVTLAIGDREQIPDLVELVVQHSGRVYGIAARKGTLEDLFVSVVEGGADK